MRLTYFLILLFVAGAIGVFALENREAMSVQFLDQSISSPRWLMIAVVYLLGMVSGWMVVGLVRRMMREATPS
jgi:uncharacterized integral membrane protein